MPPPPPPHTHTHFLAPSYATALIQNHVQTIDFKDRPRYGRSKTTSVLEERNMLGHDPSPAHLHLEYKQTTLRPDRNRLKAAHTPDLTDRPIHEGLTCCRYRVDWTRSSDECRTSLQVTDGRVRVGRHD